MAKKRDKCPVCSKRITKGVAYFSFGAVVDLEILGKKRLNDDLLEGFCDVGYHGVDSNMTDSANYCIAEDVKGGQMDISFCSLACLRRWFNDIIDYLEVESGQRKPIKPKRGGPSRDFPTP